MYTTTRTSQENTRLDKLWFLQQFETVKVTKSHVARALGLDPSSFYRTLIGQRRMQISEAAKLAQIIRKPFTEVVERAGISLPKGTVVPWQALPIVGHVTPDGKVWLGPTEGTTTAPPELGEKHMALRCRTALSPADWMDGWLLFYETGLTGVSANALNRLCVVKIKDENGLYVRGIRRGYAPDTYALFDLTQAKQTHGEAIVESASPILWIKT